MVIVVSRRRKDICVSIARDTLIKLLRGRGGINYVTSPHISLGLGSYFSLQVEICYHFLDTNYDHIIVYEGAGPYAEEDMVHLSLIHSDFFISAVDLVSVTVAQGSLVSMISLLARGNGIGRLAGVNG